MKKTILFVLLGILMSNIQLDAQICVGEQGKLDWKVWRSLGGGELSDLRANEYYPQKPDSIRTIFKLQTPFNYDNYYGGRVEGFIMVPTTETVTFNITANERARFYLSTDDDPANASQIANAPGWTNLEEHTKYPEQTSSSITLQANQPYYFLLEFVDASNSDFAAVWWKTDLVDPNVWNVITANYLYRAECLPAECPDRGTPCDDGNAATVEDMEDGHCNCEGHVVSSNTCVGERNILKRYRYDDIPGSSLDDLYQDPNYPGMPTYSQNMELFGQMTTREESSTGSLLQGYLSVPVSGEYKFNITGDDWTVMFISSDETIDNKQAHQALVTGYTNMTDHEKYLFQSTGFFYLEADKYYYVEVNSKQGGGNAHFGMFWQTPWTEPGVWKRIPSFYGFEYKCEVACIQENTPCDDGDPFTNNDMYDDNCECVGTPCSGPDCDSPLASYVPYEKCNVKNQIDNREDNNYLSCEKTTNPNSARPLSHWLMYDLGVRHEIYNSHIWNYNVAGETDKGFEMVAVDISEDGINWTELGQYVWTQADGSEMYGGFQGPDFFGQFARYILVTSLDNTTSCQGLGKVAFTTVKCPYEGTACDDGDRNTILDTYNDNCECIGMPLDSNLCEVQNLSLGDQTLATDLYSAIDYVTSISKVRDTSVVSLVGGKSVELNPGFETFGNTLFVAAIDECDDTPQPRVMSKKAQKEQERLERQRAEQAGLTVTNVADTDVVHIQFFLDTPGNVKLEILDELQQPVFLILEEEFTRKGIFLKKIRNKKLASGNYTVRLTTEQKQELKPLLVDSK